MSARLAFTRTLVQSANRSGSVSPAMSAARIARPLTPRMSVTTRVSFTFASSSVFCKRCVCRAISRTSCLRVRVRSRNSWIGAGGTKLPRISPCANRSAIQAASFRSLLRPGTFRMCCALASTSVNDASSSRTCHTGFQYTPVASIATCVQPASVSQAASASRPAVVVANSRCSVVTFRPAAMRAHAFTHREWTSNPAHRACKTSMRHLLIAKALAWSPPVRNLQGALTGTSPVFV